MPKVSPSRACPMCGFDYPFPGPAAKPWSFDFCLKCGAVLAVYPGGDVDRPTPEQLATMTGIARAVLEQGARVVKEREAGR